MASNDPEYNRKYYEKNRERMLEQGRNRDPQKRKIESQKYKENHSEEIKERKKIDYRKNINKRMWSHAKIRSRKKHLEFNIEVEDINIPNFCPILGIPLFICDKQSDNSPSLDRIDNNKGYIKGNIIVISWRANNLKSSGNITEFRAIVKFLENYYE